MAEFVAASDVRDYMVIAGTTGKYTDAVIGSNIRAASNYLQRKTGRQFELQEATAKTFTTHNRATLVVPDLQSVTSVTQSGTALTADETYWLLPDRRSSGIYTGVQFRVPYQNLPGPRYLGQADWWDRGLDMRGRHYYSSPPNDLVVTGTWGYNPLIPGTAPTLPDELLHATKVLAAFYTLRPDSVLAGVSVTPDGAVRSYEQLPMEVATFVEEWTLGEQLVAV